MCADNIDVEQVEAMRRAYVALRAAAQCVLADLATGRPALDALRAACGPDPLAFATELKPIPYVVLRR